MGARIRFLVLDAGIGWTLEDEEGALVLVGGLHPDLRSALQSIERAQACARDVRRYARVPRGFLLIDTDGVVLASRRGLVHDHERERTIAVAARLMPAADLDVRARALI